MRSINIRTGFFFTGVMLLSLAPIAAADTTPQTLPLAQNWANTALISANNDWALVPGITGYRGDNLTALTGVDPQTILADDAAPVINVTANLLDPNTFTSGGLVEAEITDPVVAFQGSGTADAPYLLISLNTTGQSNILLSYKLRDIDGSADNAVQAVALHYRVGTSGAFTNVPEAFVADASTGPSLATLVTPVSVTLPSAVNNQPVVQLRIMTTNAAAVDELIGIDDIQVGTGVDVPPTVASTTPANNATGVLANANITVNFSEAVTATGTWYTINCVSSGAHTATVSGGPSSYVLDPSPDFTFGESCTLTVLAANITDLDGTPNPMAANYVSSFTVAADIAPTVSTTVPANNATNVAIASNLTINFSEPVTTTGTWYTLSCTASGSNLTAVQTGGPQSYVLNPNADFQNGDSCTLTIIATNVLDQDGTPNPMANNVVVSFQTAPNAGNYYASVDATNATTLRTTLYNRIKDHTCYFYSGAGTSVWTILEDADQSPTDNTKVLDIYKNELYTKITDRAGTNNNPVTSYNREHTWPNSYGFNDILTQSVGGQAFPYCPYTDTHMLFASNVSYNSSRGNLRYDNCTGCSELTTVVNNGQGGGSGVYPGNSSWFSGTAFEVWNRKKGDMARAIMYMDIRYEGGTHGVTGISEPNLILTDDVSLIQTTPSGQIATTGYMGRLSTLLAWHEQDPPDTAELARNEKIFGYQGNRNPFVDRPEWARCLYSNQCGTGFTQFANGFE
jgi:endonuclease I/methionine-rich copper-binding protein CopC